VDSQCADVDKLLRERKRLERQLVALLDEEEDAHAAASCNQVSTWLQSFRNDCNLTEVRLLTRPPAAASARPPSAQRRPRCRGPPPACPVPPARRAGASRASPPAARARARRAAWTSRAGGPEPMDSEAGSALPAPSAPPAAGPRRHRAHRRRRAR